MPYQHTGRTILMKKGIILALLGAGFALASSAAQWHFPLYLDGGSPALNRVEVEVSNSSAVAADGAELKIPAAELGLTGRKKKSVRVVSGENRELLWNVFPDTDTIRKNSSIIVPVDCPAGGTSKVYIYYNAKSALEMPDYLLLSGFYKDSFEKYDAINQTSFI